MRTRFFVDFHVERTDGDRFKQYMKELGLVESWNDPCNARALPYLADTFDGGDTRLHRLRELLSREGIEWSEREEHDYSDEELRCFPLLELSVDRRPLNVGGADYGTRYDLSAACSKCGGGAVQVSPLLLPLSGFPKKGDLCATVFHEILVSTRLAEALKAARASALELRQVRFYRTNEPVPWWQFMGSFQMPHMSARSVGISGPDCDVCHRSGHGQDLLDRPYEIVYASADVSISLVPDVVRTWEIFGECSVGAEDPARSRFGEQRVLVKPKVFDVFRKLKVRHARFMPVRIAD